MKNITPDEDPRKPSQDLGADADRSQNGHDQDAEPPGNIFRIEDFVVDEEAEVRETRDRTLIEVRRPRKQEFFCALPGWRAPVKLLEAKDGPESKHYLLMGSVAQSLAPADYVLRELRLLVTNFGELILYPLGIVSGDGSPNKWIVSAREAVERAEREWIRMMSDRAAGQYLARAAEDQAIMGEPVWLSNLDLTHIIGRAFGEENIVYDRDGAVAKVVEFEGWRSLRALIQP